MCYVYMGFGFGWLVGLKFNPPTNQPTDDRDNDQRGHTTVNDQTTGTTETTNGNGRNDDQRLTDDL